MMTLLNDYFKIDSRTADHDETLFRITLLPEYRAYAGHFPGNPVSPGVCNIQMIRECAQLLTGKRLFLGYISQCRLSAVITPQTTPQLQLRMQLSVEADGIYGVRATVGDGTVTCIDFKGELTSVK
ncbi:MAG: beta-hydroxyacyl-ACP dehydratase [Tannerella sp.]|jgi:3-hydroxyacyl-[acyl-carrier-protein] dehydratase|nr:beta-hydroxyacyl-ACP dehydratase [Tannerella sp.]